jgi:hypothetical protein
MSNSADFWKIFPYIFTDDLIVTSNYMLSLMDSIGYVGTKDLVER